VVLKGGGGGSSGCGLNIMSFVKLTLTTDVQVNVMVKDEVGCNDDVC
jgi:hypothetical protein